MSATSSAVSTWAREFSNDTGKYGAEMKGWG